METAIPNLPFVSAPLTKQGHVTKRPDLLGNKHNPNFGKQGWSATPRPGILNSQIPNALFNDSDPVRFLAKERPWHRRAQAMALEGCTIKEIACFFEKSEECIRTVLRQPYNRENMINEIKKGVADEMRAFLEAEVLPTLEVVKQIRDDPNARNSDRLSAADQLLSRFLGKPTQPITQESKDVTKLSSAELEQEVARTLAGISTAPGN